MKRAGIILAAAFSIAFMCTTTNAQVPILYYDFENNATRTTFENAVEQSINGGSGAITRAGNTTTITAVGGAGTFNGGPASGQAATSNDWDSSTTDPGVGATNYYQFVVNTSGFSQIYILFDNLASATGPARVGVLYSTDGGTTYQTTTTSLTGNATFTKLTFDLSGITAVNNTTVSIRLYAYAGSAADRTGRSAFGSTGTFRIDNLQVMAASTSAAAGAKTLLNEPNIYTSTTSGATGNVFNRSNFTITGNTTISIASQQGLSGTGFTVANNAILQINAGGFFTGQGPTFNIPSTLSYNTGGTYGRGLEWSSTSGAGYPNNVAINGGTTLEMGANGGAGVARQCSGFLAVNNGTFQMAGATPMTQPVTVLGNVLITTGSLILSTASGGDLKVGGLWSRSSSSTFTPNGRAVFFNGTTAQSINISGAGGIETFDYLIVDNPGAHLTLGNATNVIVRGPSGGSALQLLNAGGINLGGNTLTLNGTVAGTNILVGGAAAPTTRTILGTGTLAITGGSKSVTSNNGRTLVTDSGVNVSLFQGMDFGAAGLTVLNGSLTLGNGGFVNTNPPLYSNTSTLIYDCACVYGRGAEWSATSGPGYPNNVTVNTNTDVNIGSTTPATPRQIAGTLNAKNGGRFLMDHPSLPMTAALTVLKNVLIESGGSLHLSTASGGDLHLQGNFTNDGTFNTNNRAVFFDGGNLQLVNAASGSLSMPYVRINKSGNTVQLNTDLTTLGTAGGDSIQFTGTASTLTLNGRTLTLGATVGATAAGSGFIGDTAADLSLQNGGGSGAMGTLVFVAGGQSLENLTINRTGTGASATLGSNLLLVNALNLNSGDILTGSFTLTHNGASTGTTDVVGNVRRTDLGATPRQFGNPNNQISFTTGTPPTEMTVNLVKSKPTGTGFGFPNAVERTYTITPTGGANFLATLRLHYLDSELNGNTEALLDFWRFNGTTWNRVPKTLADPITNNWIESSAVTQFSPWTLSATPLAPTAAKLRAFNVATTDDGMLVEWQTSFELENLGFNLYREQDGTRTLITPSPVAGSALVAGAHTALTAGNSYTWFDTGAKPTARYWLEDIDLSGKTTMHGPFWSTRTTRSIKTLQPQQQRRQLTLLSQLGAPPASSSVATTQSAQRQWPAILSDKRHTAAASVGASSASNNSPNTSGNVSRISSGDIRPGDADASPASQTPAEQQRRIASHAAVKLLVRRGGWYRVSRAQLEAAGLSQSVDPARLQLFAGGIEQPIRLDADAWQQNGNIEFYGEGLDTPTTDTEVYWLLEGDTAGRRIAPPPTGGGGDVDVEANVADDSSIFGDEAQSASRSFGQTGVNLRVPTPAPRTAQSFAYTTELRERTLYFSSLANGERENFFGRVIAATPVAQTLATRHLDPAETNTAQLEVALQGVTASTHVVRVLVNSTEVGTLEFAGREHKTAVFNVAHALLREGDNEVRMSSGAASDVSLTDYIRLTYAHLYRAENDALRFDVGGATAVRIGGFNSPRVRVVDITDPSNVTELAVVAAAGRDIDDGTYAISVVAPPTSEDERHTLLAFTDARVAEVAGIKANQPSDWHDAENAADMLVITHADFREAVAPLVARRTSEGLKVEVVDVEDLYDEWSFGAHTPEAIRSFLTRAGSAWQRAPRFVLLVGDATYDARNYTGRGSFDFVPTKLVDTVHMETASDEWLADADGDNLAEVALGRLPVRSAAEAASVVAKIAGQTAGNVAQRVLLVSDRRGADGYDFEADSDALTPLVPTGVQTERIDRREQTAETVRSQIVAGVNAGPLVVNYIGHGSINVWTGEGLLRSSDAPTLSNGNRLPLFVMMTCLNGYYHDPSLDSLAESLMKAGAGGALAVWASTGMTEPDGQALMNRELYRILFGAEHLTLGEAVRRAKATTTDVDVRRTWVLIGDPATRIE
ncbi:MAG TPA: C25 family cysteine peptidase [Pyrinomonadaceae bacterium]|jgi:hypothetical protein